MYNIKYINVEVYEHRTQLLLEKETDTNAEHFAHIIPPHSLQWCLRRATLNGFLQIGQNFTSLSAIHGTRLLSRAAKHFKSFQIKILSMYWYMYMHECKMFIHVSEEHSTLLF